MKEKIVYETCDGKIFENKENAVEHERGIKTKKVIESILVIKDYCQSMNNCENCPFQEFCENNWGENPIDWD